MTIELVPAPAGAVVVAVDGSSLADEALRWAAAYATRTGAPLHVVHAFVYVHAMGGYAVFDPADPEELGGKVCEDAVSVVRAGYPDLPVTAEVRLGPAAPQLLKAAKDAAAIVLGARGHGRVGGMLIGSVSQQVAMHARCPVVVVRGSGEHAGGPVVVGLDGSPEAARALRFALGYAGGVGAPVRAVRSTYLEAPPGVPPGAWYGDLMERVEELTRTVRAQVEAARGEFPGVDLDLRIVHRHPVEALVEEADDAQLLVVASRGLGGFTGLLLGSVSQGVLSRSRLPVAVVPRSGEERELGEERQIP